MRAGVRSIAVVALLVATGVGGCSSETDEPLFDGEAPPMPAELDEAIAEAQAAMDDAGSVEVVTRAALGPQEVVAEGRWSPEGVGSMTVVRSGFGDLRPFEVEIRSDGTTAWVRSDAPGFAEALPDGVHWIEAPTDDLEGRGLLEPLGSPWDALLFLRDLDDVEDGGVDEVDGDLVRVVGGRVHYGALLATVSPGERERMEGVVSWPSSSVRRFTAELALDGEGRMRRLDLDLGIAIGDSPRLPVELSLEIPGIERRVEEPTPPDPDDVVPADEVPEALAALGAGETEDRAPAEDAGAAPIDDPAGVLDREAPDPEPPPADTPDDAVETTTLIEGQGPVAEVGDTLYVHYVLVLADGSAPDSSWERGDPFAFTLGRTEVVAGWEEGMVGARVGERRRLVIGAEKAYGSEGTSGVPPDAPLGFEVDVVAIEPG